MDTSNEPLEPLEGTAQLETPQPDAAIAAADPTTEPAAEPATPPAPPVPTALVVSSVATRSMFKQRASDRKKTLIPVPLPWLGDGAGVFVMPLSVTGRRKLDDMLVVRKKQPDGSTKVETDMDKLGEALICLCTVDAAGARVFKDEDVGDIADMDAVTGEAIFLVAFQNAGLINDAKLEAALKNYEQTLNGGSSSTSL